MFGIIFLDFDGPIFPEKIHLYPQNQGIVADKQCRALDLHPHVKYWYADPFAIAILNELSLVTPYKLVISSSWASPRLHEKHHIEALLKINGLNFDLHDDWMTPRDPEKLRHQEIEMWLDRHPEISTNYFILDDTKSAPDLYFDKTYLSTKILKQNVYLAHENDGFNYEQFEAMKWYIEQWKELKNKIKGSTP